MGNLRDTIFYIKTYIRLYTKVLQNFNICISFPLMLEHNFQKPEVGYWKYQNQVRVEKQILSYVHVCLLPSEVLLQLKNLPKKIFINIYIYIYIYIYIHIYIYIYIYMLIIYCLFTKNDLIHFK